MAQVVRETWSSYEVARISGVHYRTLHRWTKRVEPLKSSLKYRAKHPRSGLVWTFRDLLVAWLLKDLREAGVSFQKIGKAAGYLHREGLDVQHLERVGDDLVLWLGPTSGLSAAMAPGQTIARYLVWDTEAVSAEIERAIKEEQSRRAA